MFNQEEAPSPLYLRYWPKPSNSIYEAIKPGAFRWHLIWELRTMGTEFRLQLFIQSWTEESEYPVYYLEADTRTYEDCSTKYWGLKVEMPEEDRGKWQYRGRCLWRRESLVG